MSKQDRQGPRTPADLEHRYAFGKSFAEIMGIATDARKAAEEAKSVSASVKETNDGIEARVKSLEDNASGEVALEIVEAADGTKYSQLRSDVDKIKFGAGEISIESDNFKLNEDGTIEANNGKFTGEVATAEERQVDILGETVTKEYSASLAGGIFKIVSPAAFVKNGKSYVPLIEIVSGEDTLVLVAENNNGVLSLRLVNGTFFNFDEYAQDV